MDFCSPSARWAALTTRNRLADSHFVYAVRTTKIYCRPSCSARLARRANVSFFATPALASQAGYRACKRCKPELEAQADPQDVAVAKACEIIRAALDSSEHANGHVGLNELAERVQLTPSYLHKTFKAKMGVTPKAYAEICRQERDGATAAVQGDKVLIPDLPDFDTYGTFANDMAGLDFDFAGASSLDAVSEFAGMTVGGFSDGSTTISTPMTTDWSWLDAQESALHGCEFFDAEALAQAISHQEAVAGWNDQSLISYGKEWEVVLEAVRGHNGSLEETVSETMY